jgi:hypothetical protein
MELLKLEKGDNDITLSQVSAVIFGSNRLSCTFKTNPEDSKGSVQLPDTVCNKQNLWFRTALFWNSTLRRTPKERRSNLHCGGGLKSREILGCYNTATSHRIFKYFGVATKNEKLRFFL